MPSQLDFFSSPSLPDRLLSPPSLLNRDWGLFFLGVKPPGLEADHSLPSRDLVKNERSYTSTPHKFSRRGAKLNTGYVFML
jgi:hypothetical protein